jgi:uncharacterized membrane protein HdeD (DUF308 family)
MAEPPEAETIKTMLRIARILAIIFGVIVLLGGIAFAAWVAYLSSVCSTYVGYDPYCGGAVAAALIPGIWLVIAGVVAIVVYMQMGSIRSKMDARQYEAAKSQTLIWMILGFLFGILLGIILLIAYLKFDPLISWQRGQAGGAMAYGASPGMPPPGTTAYGTAPPGTMPAPGAIPPSPPPVGSRFCSSCGSPNPPTAQFCAKCGAAMAR